MAETPSQLELYLGGKATRAQERKGRREIRQQYFGMAAKGAGNAARLAGKAIAVTAKGIYGAGVGIAAYISQRRDEKEREMICIAKYGLPYNVLENIISKIPEAQRAKYLADLEQKAPDAITRLKVYVKAEEDARKQAEEERRNRPGVFRRVYGYFFGKGKKEECAKEASKIDEPTPPQEPDGTSEQNLRNVVKRVESTDDDEGSRNRETGIDSSEIMLNEEDEDPLSELLDIEEDESSDGISLLPRDKETKDRTADLEEKLREDLDSEDSGLWDIAESAEEDRNVKGCYEMVKDYCRHEGVEGVSWSHTAYVLAGMVMRRENYEEAAKVLKDTDSKAKILSKKQILEIIKDEKLIYAPRETEEEHEAKSGDNPDDDSSSSEIHY